jgi:lipopolysaccharide transport system permease protein
MISAPDSGTASRESPDPEDWTMIIRPASPWYRLDLQGLWRYRDLVRLFVRRDFVAHYKQTILGPLWFFLQPLFSTIVFTVVFGRIAGIPTDGVPDFLFYLAGTVCWGYFAGCLTQIAETFISNAAVFGKVYFPRLVVPVSISLSQILQFFIQFSLFLGFLVYYVHRGAAVTVTPAVIILPLLMVQMGLLGIGTGLLISSLTTKYRDLRMLVGFGTQLWMFATPIVYPLSQVPAPYKIFFAINPMTAVVESFRAAFFGTGFPGAGFVAASWVITGGMLCLGLVSFNRVERTFMDTI